MFPLACTAPTRAVNGDARCHCTARFTFLQCSCAFRHSLFAIHSALFSLSSHSSVLPPHISNDPLRLTKASSSPPAAATSSIRVFISTWDVQATCLLLLHRPAKGKWAVAAAAAPSSNCAMSLQPSHFPSTSPLPCIQLPPLPTRSHPLSSPSGQIHPSGQYSPPDDVNYDVDVAVMSRRDAVFDVSNSNARYNYLDSSDRFIRWNRLSAASSLTRCRCAA